MREAAQRVDVRVRRRIVLDLRANWLKEPADEVRGGLAWGGIAHARGDVDELEVEDVGESEAVAEVQLQRVGAAVPEDFGDVWEGEEREERGERGVWARGRRGWRDFRFGLGSGSGWNGVGGREGKRVDEEDVLCEGVGERDEAEDAAGPAEVLCFAVDEDDGVGGQGRDGLVDGRGRRTEGDFGRH